MLDTETKRRIDTARDILVGKVPDPKSQVEQITIALIYKFMDDMDAEAEELGGKRSFFSGEYDKYGWSKLMAPDMGGFDVLTLYSEAIQKMDFNPGIPPLFRDIFKNAYLPYRDPETLKMFLKVINDFEYDHSERLGDAFEYLLSVLGSQGEAGQFRTPRHLIDFMVEIIDPKKNDTILDPACGTAGFLISSYKHILKHNSSNFNPEEDREAFDEKNTDIAELITGGSGLYKGDKLTPDERSMLSQNIRGYDISPDMIRLSLVNMYLHGFSDPHISEYDTLTSEDRWNEYADVILANPPFMSPKGGIKPHKRFSVQSKRSEVLFVDYIAEHLSPTGRAAVIVPEGIIFQSGTAYKQLRKMLVENYLFGVVSLPSGVFNPYSGVKTSILLMNRTLAKKTNSVLFVKIANDGFDLGAQRRPIDKNDIPQVLKHVKSYLYSARKRETFDSSNIPNVLLVDKDRIVENEDWNLSGDRYSDNGRTHSSKYELVELGKVAKLINGRAFKRSELFDKGQTPVLRVGNFFSNRDWYYSDLELTEDKYCEKGDLLYAWSASFGPRIWDGPKAIYHYHIWKIETSNKIEKRFLYFLLDWDTENIKAEGGRGIAMVHITKSGMEKREIPLPPLKIQKEIVAEIESYQKIIDGARQVVENYKPQIWIDPEWEMVELGAVCELRGGGTPSKKEDSFWKDGNIKWISSKHINEEGAIIGYELITSKAVQSSSTKIVPKGATIAITRVSVGKVAFADDDYAVNQDLTGLTPLKKDDLNEKYLFYSVRNLGPIIDENAQGLGVRGVTRAFLSKLKIPLPNLEIQNDIVAKIENEKKIVKANKELIQIFEQKIKDKIASVWGE